MGYRGFDDYESIGNYKVKCKVCGAIVDTGIMNLVKHSFECPEDEVGLISFHPPRIVFMKRKDVPK